MDDWMCSFSPRLYVIVVCNKTHIVHGFNPQTSHTTVKH